MDVFELSASLRLDKSEYEKGLDDAEKSADSKGSKISSVLAGAGKAAAVGIGAIVTATTAVSAALVGGTKEVAEYGDNIDKMSQKMGISAEAYQEWDAILQHSGTSIDSMSRGMQTLQKNAVNSADKFEKLGITQEQLANMSTEDLFSATITGLQQMGEGAERTALASELLGGSAKELGALLNTSAEDTEAMRQRVHDLGGVLSDESVKAAAAFQDSLQDMGTALSGIKRNLTAEFLPSITTAMDGLTLIFSGNIDEGKELLTEGVKQFAETLKDAIPAFLETAKTIISALGDAISDNLPTLLQAGIEIISTLLDGLVSSLPELADGALSIIENLGAAIIDNLPTLIESAEKIIVKLVDGIVQYLPQLLEAGLNIIVTLATAIINALPEIIPAVIDIILKIVDVLTEPDNLMMLIEAAIKIIIAVTQGMIKAIPKLIEATGKLIVAIAKALVEGGKKLVDNGKKLVEKVKEGFKSKIEDAKNWGKDLIQNFINGILAKWNSLKETVSNVANTVKDFLGFSEPKEGPLSNFHTYAPDMMELFMKGIRDNEDKLKDTVADAFNFEDVIVNGQTMGYNEGNGDLYSLLSQIVAALPQLASQQIVLDTGVLVGQTAPRMNRALGTIYSREQRSV